MGKDKLRKFKENETFRCLVQPATSEVLNCDHPLKGNWGRDFFGNDNPIIVELGCGKGDYTVDLAERNPSFNYIGVDIKALVCGLASAKLVTKVSTTWLSSELISSLSTASSLKMK
jgi:tRNA G46 methylase TrmB